MNFTYLPTTSADQWAALLAEPVKHWRTGFSARTLAHCWHEANGFPKEVELAFRSTDTFLGLDMLLAIPEHQVSLPGGSKPSQNDIWILARAGTELVSIAVEGKVAEPFGPTVGEWVAEASQGKSLRLDYLREVLGLTDGLPAEVRYQLLHRAASAIIEARRFTATHAVMLVHSFSETNQWFDDYAAFASLLGANAALNKIVPAGTRGGVQLHLGWVCGNKEYLGR